MNDLSTPAVRRARILSWLSFGGVRVEEQLIHKTADGRCLMVVHGDIFDGVVLYARWLAFLGDHAYQVLLRANVVFNALRRRLGLPYWSLSAYLKRIGPPMARSVATRAEALP